MNKRYAATGTSVATGILPLVGGPVALPRHSVSQTGRRRVRAVLIYCALNLLVSVRAEGQFWAFHARRYFDPLRAEVRAAQPTVLFPARSSQVEFSPNTSQWFVGWDITTGLEIPLIGWESQPTRTGDFTRGNWGVGLWLPISFHMIEDVFDSDNSSPIVNTDYRFAAILKAQWQAWTRSSLQARVSVGHESTHLGDEFSLLAVQSPASQFRRVNVSYEALEYGVSFQHMLPIKVLGEAELLLRHTGVYPVNAGYYAAELRETGGGTVTPPSRKYQWGFGAQLVPDESWRPWISVELRNRIVYGYDRPSTQDEDTKLSVNVLVGTRTANFDFTSHFSVELYFRYYHGVNPAGQFRNDRQYTIYGTGLLVRLGAR